MNKFTLNFQTLSHAMQSRMLDMHGHLLPVIVPQLAAHFADLEKNRSQMNYNTGSISLAAGIFLFMAANTLKPKIIVEVGTFLGKSTTALAMGAGWNDTTERVIHTCDKDNPCLLPELIGNVRIQPNSGRTSSEMFRQLVQEGIKTDFLSLDGRLLPEDIPLVRDMCHEETVILLDDFEGIEKGVVNYQLLTTLMPQYLFLPPVWDVRFRALGIVDSHCTALLMPSSMLTISRQ